jgi:hypothetical protein
MTGLIRSLRRAWKNSRPFLSYICWRDWKVARPKLCTGAVASRDTLKFQVMMLLSACGIEFRFKLQRTLFVTTAVGGSNRPNPSPGVDETNLHGAFTFFLKMWTVPYISCDGPLQNVWRISISPRILLIASSLPPRFLLDSPRNPRRQWGSNKKREAIFVANDNRNLTLRPKIALHLFGYPGWNYRFCKFYWSDPIRRLLFTDLTQLLPVV